MTAPGEMTFDEVATHAAVIATTKTEEAFVVAFAAYVRDVVERETDPYEKIALFVHGMLERHGKVIDAMARDRRVGSPQ